MSEAAKKGHDFGEIALDEREQAMLEALQKELHIDDPDELVSMLVRQAYFRTTVACPRCGHMALQTDESEALCRDCLSPLRLIEGMWQVVGYDNL
jgi:hypothetical protein